MPDLIDLNSYAVSISLNVLLKDRTTDENIIFATDAYEGVSFDTQMTRRMLARNAVDIRPRVAKSLEEQTLRTRRKAEVFTPSWICNKMNNHCDTEWFGRENVFNEVKGQSWIPTEGSIEFPEGKSWKDYVDSTRLEITCGEAPYLVSRYDASTGDPIPIPNRIGLLDRKLRVVNENTNNRRTWNQWVYRAFESTYGYEYQGDNLLIARINLLETFCEYTRYRWKEEPTDATLKRIAYIISWNLWQMDGIRGIVPNRAAASEPEPQAENHQMTLFEFMGDEEALEPVKEIPETIDCRIYDWREGKSISYKSIKGE